MLKQEMRDPRQWAMLLAHLHGLLELGSIGDNNGG